MKILVCGDLHFGVRGNSVKHLDFQSKWFREELIPSVKNHKCDKVVFLGDVFDNRNNLSPLVLQRVRELFKELTEVVKTYCILGNHDIFFRNNKSVHSLDVLVDQGVKVFKKPTVAKFSDKKILFLPWIVKDEKNNIAKILVNDNYDICFGHLEINGFEQTKDVTEKEGFRGDLFANCKKVFSGHFHLRRNHGNIIYTGSPFELTWNDYTDDKGTYILDTDDMSEEFVPTINTPKHIKLTSKNTKLEEINEDNITNNIVKIVFNEEISEVNRINFIEKINSLEPFSCTVDNEIDTDFDSDEDIESDIKDTLSFLQDYLNLIEVPEDLDKKIIMEKIEEIYNKCI